jgi:hypothetical protein
MSTLKTQMNDNSVEHFIHNIAHQVRQQDAQMLLNEYMRITDEKPKMWGDSIVGFGEYRYLNAAGKEQCWMKSAFSPRKQYISVYLMAGVGQHAEQLNSLGKFKHGKACLNINKLADVDINTLYKMIQEDWNLMGKKYPL